MERVKFIQHQGQPILFLDFSGCSIDDMLECIEEAREVIRSQPKKSVLTLTDVTNARYNVKVLETMIEFINGNRPFVEAGAVVGMDSLKKTVYKAIIKYSGRKLPAFDDIEKAKDWLVRQRKTSSDDTT